MKRIPIATAKTIRESLGATHVVIFAVTEDGQQHVATHGQTRNHAKEAAIAGNKLASALGWPDGLCKSTPLERICKNCVYWKADWGTHCFNGWTGDGTQGHCHAEPKRVPVSHDWDAAISSLPHEDNQTSRLPQVPRRRRGNSNSAARIDLTESLKC